MNLSSTTYRYGMVIAVCGIAIVAGWASGAEATCLLLAIIISSLYGERYQSLLAVGISVLAFDFFFLSPRYHLTLNLIAYPRFIAFILSAFVIRHLIRSREERIRKSARELRELIDFIPHHVLVFDPDGRLLEANRMVLDYVGSSLEEMREMSTDERIGRDIHPDDIERSQGERSRNLAMGRPFEVERRARGRDGQYRWFLFRYKPLLDETGHITRWFCTATDIEEMKRDDERLRLVIDTIPSLTWTARPDGSAEFVNRRWLEYAGLSLEQAVDWGFTIAIHPDDVPHMMKAYKEALSSGEFFEAEGRIRRADGEYRWFLFRGSALRDDSGDIIQWFGTNTDIEDRRRAEDALRASEQNLNLILDMLPGFVWSADPSGEFEYLNRQALDYSGKTLEELKELNMAIHPDDVEARTLSWEQMLESGEPSQREFRLRRFDGTYRWFQSRTRPLRSETGEVIRWFGVLWDIDERKQAEATIEARENHIRTIVESIPGMVVVTEPDGPLKYANQRVLDYVGMRLPELIPYAWIDCLHPEDAVWVPSQWVHHCATSGSTWDVIYRIRRADGEFRWFNNVGLPLYDDHHRLLCWYCIFIDIDDRKKMEEELRRSEEKFRLMIDTIPAFAWCATPEGGPAYINKRMATYTGISEDQLQNGGRSTHGEANALSPVWRWKEMMHPDDFNFTLPLWSNCLRTGDSYSVECRLKRFDGTFRWFQIRGEPLRDASGRITNWYGVNIDIDDSRKMAEAFRRMQTRLSRATQIATVAELSASIAHEINQPLAAVVANGDACESWLSTDPPNLERARLAVHRIIRDGNAAAEVIQRIRALFKQATPNKAALDMNEVIDEVLRLVSGKVQRKMISVETDLSPDLPRVLADRIQMQQLMMNLVHNAIEAMEGVTYRSRRLFLRSRRNDINAVLIEVRDHGSGLKDSERAFEPFFTTKEKGMGMGLSICRSIIDTHEGSLWATQNEDQGTTFSITLPILSKEL